MRGRVLFPLAVAGLLLGLGSAYVFNVEKKSQPPVFSPASNPYARGIYANGIVESLQASGENVNLFPEVSGTVSAILVAEGDSVAKGQRLLTIDDSVQRAVVEQQRSQADASLALLEALKAQPRPETLAIAQAQVELARANLKSAQDQHDRQNRLHEVDPRAISKDALDNALNALKVASANVDVARRQQELQHEALHNAYRASSAQLERYTVKAPTDGVVLSIRTAVGSYVSPQGVYGTYTGGLGPLIVLGSPQDHLAVRCYVDEILVHRLPEPSRLRARMQVRGTSVSIPLEYVRTQPYVGPKISLSDQRAERVDLRVLPIIFRLAKPAGLTLYPGQLVDVYIGDAAEEPAN